MKKNRKSYIKITCPLCYGKGSYDYIYASKEEDCDIKCSICNGTGRITGKVKTINSSGLRGAAKEIMKGNKMTKRNKTGWLTVKQAAYALGILPKSVMRRIQRGTMKFKTQKDGTRLVYLAA